jgi:hypothetical protein
MGRRRTAMKLTVLLIVGTLMLIGTGFAQGEAQVPSGMPDKTPAGTINKEIIYPKVLDGFDTGAPAIDPSAFNPADPITCAANSAHKVYGKEGVVQYFSCDGGKTLHAFLEWTGKSKENRSILHGIAETEGQANSLTKTFLEDTYAAMLDSPHACPGGQMKKASLQDKNGHPYVEWCGNPLSPSENRYVTRDEKAGKAAIAGFNREKGK